MAKKDAHLRPSPRCFVLASPHIVERGLPVGLMFRSAPATPGEFGIGEGEVSGWGFASGQETERELGDPDFFGMYTLEQILRVDPAVEPYLATPAPCTLERDEEAPVFYQVDDEDDEAEDEAEDEDENEGEDEDENEGEGEGEGEGEEDER